MKGVFLSASARAVALLPICIVTIVSQLVSPKAFAADTTPPTILSTNPPAGSPLSSFTQITFVFSEPVVGVEADDLQINSDGAASVTGIGGTNFTFAFTQPPAGTVYLYWDADHGITDQAGNPFQAGDSWTYTLVDSAAPSILLVSPPAGATVTRFTQLEITFTEAVTNVDAADLLLNGVAAQTVSGVAAGPYLFTFAEPGQGTVNVSFA